MKLRQSDLHNALVPEVVKRIIKPVQATGGDQNDVLVILESVVSAVIAYLVESSVPGPKSMGALADACHVANILNEAVKERLETIIDRETPQ